MRRDYKELRRLAKDRAIEYYVTTEKDAVKLDKSELTEAVQVLVAVAEPVCDPDGEQKIRQALEGVL